MKDLASVKKQKQVKQLLINGAYKHVAASFNCHCLPSFFFLHSLSLWIFYPCLSPLRSAVSCLIATNYILLHPTPALLKKYSPTFQSYRRAERSKWIVLSKVCGNELKWQAVLFVFLITWLENIRGPMQTQWFPENHGLKNQEPVFKHMLCLGDNFSTDFFC